MLSVFTEEDERFMRLAIEEACKAGEEGEIPIGAVVVSRGRMIAKAHNLTERLRDVTAHAEMQAITAAMDSIGGKYLEDCTLYVTVEPCPMCASALNWAQLGRLVFGTEDPKRGYLFWDKLREECSGEDVRPERTEQERGRSYRKNGMLHPSTRVDYGLMAEECRRLMQEFFKNKR